MSKRIYVVVVNGTQEHLVRASSASQAIRAVADPMFKVGVANQDDLLRLAKTHTVKEA